MWFLQSTYISYMSLARHLFYGATKTSGTFTVVSVVFTSEEQCNRELYSFFARVLRKEALSLPLRINPRHCEHFNVIVGIESRRQITFEKRYIALPRFLARDISRSLISGCIRWNLADLNAAFKASRCNSVSGFVTIHHHKSRSSWLDKIAINTVW